MTPTDNPDTQILSTDPRPRFAGAAHLLTDVLAAVTPDQHDLPTPCEAMTVGEMSEHVVMVMRRVACAGRGLPVPEWPIDAADVAPGDWSAELSRAASDVQQVWSDDALLERPTALPWGTFPGAAVLGVYTNELTVHAWDLARATGQSPEWDADVISAANDAIHQQLPVADRTPMWEALVATLPAGIDFSPPFADAVEVSDDAPLIDQLVAWNGRRP